VGPLHHIDVSYVHTMDIFTVPGACTEFGFSEVFYCIVDWYRYVARLFCS
jgi:hypothetical protein